MCSKIRVFKHIPENTVLVDAVSHEIFLFSFSSFFFFSLLPLFSLCSHLSTLFIYNFLYVVLSLFSWQVGTAPLAATVTARIIHGSMSCQRMFWGTSGPISHASELDYTARPSWLVAWHRKAIPAYLQKSKCSHLSANHYHRHKYPVYRDLILERRVIFLSWIIGTRLWNDRPICCIFILPVHHLVFWLIYLSDCRREVPQQEEYWVLCLLGRQLFASQLPWLCWSKKGTRMARHRSIYYCCWDFGSPRVVFLSLASSLCIHGSSQKSSRAEPYPLVQGYMTF